MKKQLFKVGALALVLSFASCAELQQAANNLPKDILSQSQELTSTQIGNGLKEALEKGVRVEVSKLAMEKGFYNNPVAKINLPKDLQKVDSKLRDIGLGNVADKGIEKLNEAASEAVKEATPIFVEAIKGMSFQDAKKILLGNDDAATLYLESKTEVSLQSKFEPIIKKSFDKVGANDIWETIIKKYNAIPFADDINPDLTDYVTKEALKGVYKMIAIEELKIREDVKERTSDLMKKVFALQDK
ncbi:DUF4197 domain-containing protein [Aureivirga sp. CE67]|uniref:DUF4197 domain-containing protein n=1 Tax=Aureivirga sp. CE67 TaxID=1788983 RepID=UPI0018CA8B90|nr:DUF4197 domain-containing protein [Aureivirga sp. CE67]